MAVIGFGSNLGDGVSLLLGAWKRLTEGPDVRGLRLSPLFRSEAVGMVSQTLFTNGVGLVETRLDPSGLLRRLMDIETEYGRRRDPKRPGYQDRYLDLDLLYFGDTICRTSELILPHPAVPDRMFVLAPLVEIAPDLVDPASGMTVFQMFQGLFRKIQQGEVPAQRLERIDEVA